MEYEEKYCKRLYPNQTQKVILAKRYIKLLKEKQIILLKTDSNKKYE